MRGLLRTSGTPQMNVVLTG